MMTIEQMAQKNGHFKHNGKEYVLVRQAFIDGPVDSPYFVGRAIVPVEGEDEGGMYDVYDILWNCIDDWLAGDQGDMGDACDWDNPDEVFSPMTVYDLANDVII